MIKFFRWCLSFFFSLFFSGLVVLLFIRSMDDGSDKTLGETEVGANMPEWCVTHANNAHVLKERRPSGLGDKFAQRP